MKKLLFIATAIPFIASAQEVLEPIKVETEHQASSWKEQEKTNILSGKKNRSSQVEYLPPIQTDNNRQHFAQQASIYVAEQSTEPWPAMSFRGIGDPHEAQNILILQDGLPVSVDMYGQPGNYYAPPAPLMEELQVIAGGGALMYGPQPGAAINYQTPSLAEGMPLSGKINVAAGSYNLFSTVNSISGSSGKTSYYGGYYRKQGDGLERENADFSADYLQLKTRTFLSGNQVFKTAFQGYDSDYGQPGGKTLKEGPGLNTFGQDGNRKATRKHDRLKIARALVMVGYEKKISNQTYLDSQLWGVAYKRYSKTQNAVGNNFGTFPLGTNNAINDVRSYGVNGEVRIRHDWEKWNYKQTLSVGYLTYNSDSPTHTQTGRTVDSNSGTTNARADRTTRTQAVFLENRFNFGKLSIIPGIRYENINMSAENRTTDIKQQDTYNVLLGGLGSSYDLTDSTQVFANVSQGFKPIGYGTVLQMGTPNIVVQGDIKPSYNYLYEAGIRGESLKFNWDTSLYLIHRQNLLVTSGNVVSNGSSAQYRGVESSLTYKDFLNSKSQNEMDAYLNVNFQNAKFHGGSTEGKTPAYVPSVLLKYGLIYRRQNKLKASLMGTFVNEHFADDTHSDEFKIPSYQVFDLLAEYNISKSWSVNGAINNLLDEEYYNRVRATGIMPTMGRNYYAGLNYRF